jgi:hypothetical protein
MTSEIRPKSRMLWVEHGLSTFDCPSHAGTFKAVLDEMAAGSFDQASGDRIPGSEVFVVLHPVAMSLEITACCFTEALRSPCSFFISVRRTAFLPASFVWWPVYSGPQTLFRPRSWSGQSNGGGVFLRTQQSGRTVRECCQVAGVHVSSFYRWQNRSSN